eukprot:CAMPEP_0117663280 /NCGR_PEP_ID=MMETSP0804-20121206/8518_1 /TAXON_ID=1074897 /ORGANISM="Tetraselmis astigmatica, Strain CCMP880" /LENGTH=120 /DNA_ID=CAMNT_0005470267 /DNA_START=142 /DNA_END=504 /DNA_ORIENTATION=+
MTTGNYCSKKTASALSCALALMGGGAAVAAEGAAAAASISGKHHRPLGLVLCDRVDAALRPAWLPPAPLQDSQYDSDITNSTATSPASSPPSSPGAMFSFPSDSRRVENVRYIRSFDSWA